MMVETQGQGNDALWTFGVITKSIGRRGPMSFILTFRTRTDEGAMWRDPDLGHDSSGRQNLCEHYEQESAGWLEQPRVNFEGLDTPIVNEWHQARSSNHMSSSMVTVLWTNRFISMIRRAQVRQRPGETTVWHL
jgi:hypothetical protein